jgi:RNA polymerase sigma-70 factor (ECF subfamily)
MEEDSTSETKLVRQLLGGSDKALIIFHQKYSPILRRYIKTKVEVPEDAEEIVQDTFLAALDSLALFRGGSTLSTWLIGIARHEIADYFRRKKIKSVVFSRFPNFQQFVSKALEPDAGLMRKEYEEQVKRALRLLLPKQRLALELKYMDGMQVRDIGRELGITYKACESLLSRARKAFILAYEREH